MSREERASARARELLQGERLLLIANREPWIHEQSPEGVIIRRSPGGLVTGVEPMMLAAGGTWIAHGSGSADFEVTDEHDRVAVPPESPAYQLSRIPLSDDEVNGYYERFANQVLWPLCHVVFVRPRFDGDAFRVYEAVNEKFAERAARELEGDRPIVLVQDYHFALLPTMLRKRRPDAVINIFWHIPWPPADVFRRCPWARELVEGLLGADIVGFHTPEYASNFLDTVAMVTEGSHQVDSERVVVGDREVRVGVYPISIEWREDLPTRDEGREFVRKQGLTADHLLLGVDRIDYTKGLPQRLDGIAELFRRYPDARGSVTYVQLGSPSRTAIKEYANLGKLVESKVAEINETFGESGWNPIFYERRNIPASELDLYFAMADAAVVTPLHDGMNLVAKEFVRACTDAAGALVLSEFAGAAAELNEAILVNPWSAEEIAEGIADALEMPADEKTRRMMAMREKVSSHDVYDWALAILEESVAVRSSG